jgi:replicative DNA helicase
MLSDLRESGCLSGETLIELSDSGRRVPIRELVGRPNPCVWALDEETEKLRKADVAAAFSTGIKPVHRLRTRLGRTIRATASHRFLTIDGWKRLDEVQVGEHLALPRTLGAPAAQTMTGGELALLGHLIGDGCTIRKHAIQYTTRERDLAELVARLAIECFGSTVKPRIHQDRTWYQVFLPSSRRTGRGVKNPIREWLEGMGVWGLRSYEKRVPDHVFEQPASAAARFLRHLWSTDGCVRPGKGRRQPAVYYTSSSEALAVDVHDLLLRLGITGIRRTIPQGAKGRPQHQVWISGSRDLDAFCRTIGAVGAYKSNDVARVQDLLAQRGADTNRDVIPKEVWSSRVRPAMRETAMTHRQLHRDLGMAYSGTTVFKQNLSRDRAGAVAEVVSSSVLQRLARSDIYWDSVTSVEPDGVEEVFDLTVPGPHNFVANGIIAHNSIEQDADVVMFLYRPEYYAPPEKREELEGKSELIVGKQRNGPTGVIDLYFQKAYTRFDSAAPAHAHGGGPRPQQAGPGYLP